MLERELLESDQWGTIESDALRRVDMKKPQWPQWRKFVIQFFTGKDEREGRR